MLGLVGDVGLAPRARHDDGGTCPAEFGTDRLGPARRARGLRRVSLGTTAEHDGLVGPFTAGDVDLSLIHI